MNQISLLSRKGRYRPQPIVLRGFRLSLAVLLLLTGAFSLITSPVSADPPNIYPSPLPDGQVDVPYNTSILAENCPCTWQIVSGSLPPGLTLNASGIISGTPTTAGAYTFIAEAANGDLPNDTQPFVIDITDAAITISTTSLPNGLENESYAASFSATDATPPLFWSISGGALPPGLILGGSTGTISGILQRGSAGSYNFTVTVTDSASTPRTAQRTYSIFIEKGTFEPQVTISDDLAAGTTKVYANGVQITSLGGGESVLIAFESGTSNTITVDPVVKDPSDDNIRYRTKDDSITVNELSPSAVFTYFVEYNVIIRTDPNAIAVPGGSGWYEEDSMLSTSAESTVDGSEGTQYRFTSWKVNNETMGNASLSLAIIEPKTITAQYDTYYFLTINTAQSEGQGSDWYKAGSQATWGVVDREVRMDGVLGFFRGKYVAVNPGGTEIMDGPKSVTTVWKANNTMPAILIPLTVLLVGLVIFGIYYLMKRSQAKQPYPYPPYQQYPYPYMSPPPPPQPLPPPQTTVVMIGDTKKHSPESTKEQLVEKFGQLLDIYEKEIRSSIEGGEAPPRLGPVQEANRLQAPAAQVPPVVPVPPVPPSVPEAEYTAVDDSALCHYATRKLLRTVVSPWTQGESKEIELPATGRRKKPATGRSVTWMREIFNEWAIFTCTLPKDHKGLHEGNQKVMYSLLNTVTQEKTYTLKAQTTPPTPHYTDGMPEVDVNLEQVIPRDELPGETLE